MSKESPRLIESHPNNNSAELNRNNVVGYAKLPLTNEIKVKGKSKRLFTSVMTAGALQGHVMTRPLRAGVAAFVSPEEENVFCVLNVFFT